MWNRNFIMVIAGQIISLFGNAVLRFALPLADAKMDNATKAKIAEKTVRDAVTGIQKMLKPDEYFRKQ